MGCCQSHLLQTQSAKPFQDCIIQISNPSEISSQKSIKQNILNNNKDRGKYQPICPEQIGFDSLKCSKLNFLEIPQSKNYINFFPQTGYTLRVSQKSQLSRRNVQTQRSMREMQETLNTMILQFQKVEGGYSKKLIPLINNKSELNQEQLNQIKRIHIQNKQNQRVDQQESSYCNQLKPKNLQRQTIIPTISPIDLKTDIKQKNKSPIYHSAILTKNLRASKDQQQEEQHTNSSYSKCQLSNPSRILNQSILLTQRQNQKENFYNKYVDIFQNSQKAYKKMTLKKWSQLNRQGYEIQTDKIIQNASTRANSFDSVFRVVMMAISLYKKSHKINLISYIPQGQNESQSKMSGLRIFLNGQKRLFCFNQIHNHKKNQSEHKAQEQVIQKSIKQVLQILHQQKQEDQTYVSNNPVQLIYNLSGWIPQQINLQQITNLQGVLERLSTNFVDGNTIITFTVKLQIQIQQEDKQVKIHFALKQIDLKQKRLKLYGFILKQLQDQFQKQFLDEENGIGMRFINNCEYEVNWDKFLQKVQVINVNWNISIYDFTYRFQSTLFPQSLKADTLVKKIDNENINHSSIQYLLKIPSNEQDIQLRLFLQTHRQYPTKVDSFGDNEPQILIQLYDYLGYRVNSSQNHIRQLSKTQNVWSDVLIFEASKQKNEYVLLVRLNQNAAIQGQQQISYSLKMFSFTQVLMTQLPSQQVLSQKIVQSYINPSQTGYGINSPFFLKNIHFSLSIPLNSHIKIFAQGPQQHKFQICIIGDVQKKKNLTKVNLQGILNDINCSQQIQTKGYFDIVSKYQDNILILTSYTESKGPIKVVVQVVQKYKKSLLQNYKEIILADNLIKFKEISSYQKSMFSKQIKWFPTNPGPRKRLKSNTNSQFQQYSVFSQFFKNPYIDYKIQQKGVYQFSIISEAYEQMFMETETYQQKQDLQPITLSMGIFQIAQKGKMFKIVMDDAFYVPFGFGFWSKQMLMSPGNFRFVFPKMEKDGGNGIFSIYRTQ